MPRMRREPAPPRSPLVILLEVGVAINPCSLQHNTFLTELECFSSLWCQTKSCFQLFVSKAGPAPCCVCVSQLTWSPQLCEVTMLPTFLNFSLFGLYSVTAASGTCTNPFIPLPAPKSVGGEGSIKAFSKFLLGKTEKGTLS